MERSDQETVSGLDIATLFGDTERRRKRCDHDEVDELIHSINSLFPPESRCIEEELPDGQPPEGTPWEGPSPPEQAVSPWEYQIEEVPPIPASVQKKKARNRHIRTVLGDILFYFVLIVIVVSVLSAKRGGDGPLVIAGYSAHTVLTGSMQDTLPQGSLIITRSVDPAALSIGDDITYMRDAHTTVTHRIVGIAENYENSGQRAFQTKGTRNIEPDEEMVYGANVVGKVIYHSVALGKAANFIVSYWYILVAIYLILWGAMAIIKKLFQISR